MKIHELWTLCNELVAQGKGDKEIEVFEMRTSCTMPVVGGEFSEGVLTVLVDMADS